MKRHDKVAAWLAAPLPADVARSIERLARIDDIERIALMPDVHLAEGVCVGTVVGSRTRIYPDAVGADIGCGMSAVAFIGEWPVLDQPLAERIMTRLRSCVPASKHPNRCELPEELAPRAASAPKLGRLLAHAGAAQLGTLGRGNHFLELQSDDSGALWLMVHSGSRALGPAVREHHLANAEVVGSGLRALDAESDAGRAYLSDHDLALRYAAINRQLILSRAAAAVADVIELCVDPDSLVTCSHNFVRREEHDQQLLWVHRKGAISAREAEPGIIPGSMGSESYLVSGRGCARALASSSHGAGRAMNRTLARHQIGIAQLKREMADVWFDGALGDRLRDEAPSAYKPIAAVMRAQKPLTRILRRLRPRLVYKAG
jgi:tRNA-splicing ligase RtcB (3'-phosphate/5'-hydroxy nucleic acid ligase)